MYLRKEAKVIDGPYKSYFYRFSWLHLARPLTLSGTITTVLAGTGISAINGSIRFDLLVGMLIASIFVQAAINMFNDYYDFRNGQDSEKWFIDQGQKLSHTNPSHHLIPFVAILLLCCASVIGIWLALNSSYWILLIGFLGIGFGIAYSAGSSSLAARGLGELVAAIFLGFVPTIVAFVVQGYPVNIDIILVSIPFALLISSMILTNNIRDYEKDKGFRNTLARRLGIERAVRLLLIILCSLYFSVLLLISFKIVPWIVCIVFFALPKALRLYRSFTPGAKREDEIAAMKFAALHHWIFGSLFVIGLWGSSF